MGNVLKWIKWVFDWRFLPAKFQRWLFSTGTRAVKFVNAFGLFGYAMVFFLYGKVLYQYKLYDKFDTAPPKVTATVMLVLAVLQIILMVGKTDRSQIVGGYLLICSGFVWFMVALVVTTLVFNLDRAQTYLPLAAMVCAGALGLLDDIINLKSNGKGKADLNSGLKFLLMAVIAGLS